MADLTYRDLGPQDFDALHDIGSRWEVVRQLGGWPWPPQPEFTTSRCKPYAGDGFVWGICEGDTLLGSVAVTKGEIGYMLHPKAAGRGIMSVAVADVMKHARDAFGVTTFVASVWHDNPASKRVLEKHGLFHWQTAFVPSRARKVPTLCHFMRTNPAASTS